MSTFAYPLVSLFFITVAYISEASIIRERYFVGSSSLNPSSTPRSDWSRERSARESLIRMEASPQPIPLICRPQVINPSVKCGCSVFRSEYEGVEEYTPLEKACIKEVGSDLTAGYRLCSRVDFRGTVFEGRNLRQSNEYNTDLWGRIFKQARQQCVFTPGITPAALSPGVRQSTHEVSVLGEVPRMDTSREGTETWSFDEDSINSLVVRKRANEKLRDFCMIVLWRQRVGRRKAYCLCSPRVKTCKQ